MYGSDACLDNITVQVFPGWIVPMGRIELEANPCVKVPIIHPFEAISANSSDQRQPNGNEKLVSTTVFIAVS